MSQFSVSYARTGKVKPNWKYVPNFPFIFGSVTVEWWGGAGGINTSFRAQLRLKLNN